MADKAFLLSLLQWIMSAAVFAIFVYVTCSTVFTERWQLGGDDLEIWQASDSRLLCKLQQLLSQQPSTYDILTRCTENLYTTAEHLGRSADELRKLDERLTTVADELAELSGRPGLNG